MNPSTGHTALFFSPENPRVLPGIGGGAVIRAAPTAASIVIVYRSQRMTYVQANAPYPFSYVSPVGDRIMAGEITGPSAARDAPTVGHADVLPMHVPAVTPRPRAVMTIDVEEWFHVENLREAIPRGSWDARELRAEAVLDGMLEALAQRGIKATFFVLGWLAERKPNLVRAMVAAGHEIACHGYGHELVSALTPAAFRNDVLRARGLLEDLSGLPVNGYRAPCFSITDAGLDVLGAAGFSYDSSAYVVAAHDRYGRVNGLQAGHCIVQIRPRLAELCVSVLPLGRWGLPWGGGGYFRLLPYTLFRAGVRSILDGGRPYVFYVHPWELDPAQPRVAGLSRSARFRHYVNLHRCEERWRSLLADFEWTTAASLLATWGACQRIETGGQPRQLAAA